MIPDVVSNSDYYPGGMLMPGRNFNSNQYSRGYNGQLKVDEIMLPIFAKNYYENERGNKVYELTSHLGNVHSVVADRKIPIQAGSSGNIDYYTADVVSNSDYYPFGSLMPQRFQSAEKYRFGFNGQEKIDEIKGPGNHNTALFWEYDTRLGRRWNVDPLAAEAPGWSPYRAFYCNPIFWTDPTGLLEWNPQVDDQGNTSYSSEKGDNLETFKSQYNLSDDKAKDIFKQNNLNTTGNVKEGTSISGESVKKATGSDILKLDLTSPQATHQRKLDHLVFSLDRSKKDGFEMDPKQYFSRIKAGTTSPLSGTGGLTGRGNINVNREKVNVFFDVAINWNSKSENYPVTISPTRVVNGKNVNAIIYQRANSRGFQSIQIVVPANQVDGLFDRLNK